jgi:hypothetical protein
VVLVVSVFMIAGRRAGTSSAVSGVSRLRPGNYNGWVILDYGPDETYTTPLLPDFQLPVTPTGD